MVKDDAVMKEDATAEGKEAKNVSSNLDDVAATVDATADNIDKAEFQNSTVAVSTATTTVFSTEFVSNRDNFLSNLIVVVAADDNNLNAKLKIDVKNSIGKLNDIRQEYLPTEYNDVKKDSVSDDNNYYGVIYDRTDDDNPPSLPPESNMPCIHSIIGEVNEEFHFWNGISNEEPNGNNDHTCNDTVPNQADNNRPSDGESKILLLCSLEHLDRSQIEVSIRETNTLNTLICEVNEEYSFWCIYQNEEYPVDLIATSTKSKASQQIDRYDQEEYHDDSIGVVDFTW